MKIYEFSLVFRHTTKTDKNLKMRFEGDDVRKICEQAVVWLVQRLRSKVQYQWELPNDATVMAGIDKTMANEDGCGVISNMIDGLIVKVRHVAKPVKARKATA